jgi:hypothetical protein
MLNPVVTFSQAREAWFPQIEAGNPKLLPGCAQVAGKLPGCFGVIWPQGNPMSNRCKAKGLNGHMWGTSDVMTTKPYSICIKVVLYDTNCSTVQNQWQLLGPTFNTDGKVDDLTLALGVLHLFQSLDSAVAGSVT